MRLRPTDLFTPRLRRLGCYSASALALGFGTLSLAAEGAAAAGVAGFGGIGGPSTGLLSLATLALGAAQIRRTRQLEAEMARRERAEHYARSLAQHDPLTGLYNREWLLQWLDDDFARAGAVCEAGPAVLVLGLDRFRRINDMHGHAAGDRVLMTVAKRLLAVVGSDGSVGRIGGDEFGVVLPGCSNGAYLAELAQQLLATVELALDLGKASAEITCSIGIAMAPADGLTGQALLDHADMAMYRAKELGRNGYAFFEEQLNLALRERAEAIVDLRRALRDGEIVPFFQPSVDISTGRLLGFEVLARWLHPERGLVSPALFIPVAEQNGLIGDICQTILEQACRIASAWPAELRIAVNISPIQFNDRWLAEKIVGVLTATGFPAGRLEVEVTETALVADGAAARETLIGLKNQGVRIALDDFGTGYSGMQSLLELPLDRVKIDRSFVSTCTTSAESRKIVAAIVGLARSFGLPTTAEGIELPAHADFLVSLGCDEGQGFLYSKPLPAAQAAELAQRWQDFYAGTATPIRTAVEDVDSRSGALFCSLDSRPLVKAVAKAVAG